MTHFPLKEVEVRILYGYCIGEEKSNKINIKDRNGVIVVSFDKDRIDEKRNRIKNLIEQLAVCERKEEAFFINQLSLKRGESDEWVNMEKRTGVETIKMLLFLGLAIEKIKKIPETNFFEIKY